MWVSMTDVVTIPDWTGHIRFFHKDIGQGRTLTMFCLQDYVSVATGKDKRQSAESIRRIMKAHPEVEANCFHFQFPGQGEKEVTCGDIDVLLEVSCLLGGKKASQFRHVSMKVFRLVSSGDRTNVTKFMDKCDTIQGNPLIDACREKTKVEHDIQEEYLANFHSSMKAIKDTVHDPTYHYALLNDSLNCAVTGFTSTKELKRKRGWDGKAHVSGRSVMTTKEKSLVSVAHAFHVEISSQKRPFLEVVNEVSTKIKGCALLLQ